MMLQTLARVGLVLSLLLLHIAQPLCAQQRTRIFGRITDSDGGPVSFASVRVRGQAALGTSNLKGDYELWCTSTDSVQIIYSLVGHETRKRLLRWPGDSVRLDVRLPELGWNSLGTAEVVAQGIQTGTVQRLTPKDIKLMPSATGNAVEEMVATQAGVSTHNELSSQYNVRGGSFDENCVYINGIEVFRPMLVRSAQQEGLSVINAEMVEKIGFSSGGFEAKYGDRMSSVLDITYKRPERFFASGYASMLGAGATSGWGNGKVGVMGSLRYKTTRYMLGSLDTQGEYDPRFIDLQANAWWQPSKKWSVEFLGGISDNTYRFKPKERETSFGTINDPKTFKVYFDGGERDCFRTNFAAASLTHHFTDRTYLTGRLTAFSTSEEETYDIRGEYWLNESSNTEQAGVGSYMEHGRDRLRARVLGAALRFGTKIASHTLQAGFDFQHEKIRERAREWELHDSMDYTLPYDPDMLRFIYCLRSSDSISSSRLALFAQDAWRIQSKVGLWNLTYGLRLSHWSWNGETLFSPRLSVGLLPTKAPQWTFRLATGFYYQAPFYKELKDTVMVNGVADVRLNRHIRSQRSIHFVAGADYNFRWAGRPFRLTGEAYYKLLSDLIPYTVDNMRLVYYGRNVAKGYAAGIDFKLYGEFVPGTDSWITFSLMRTKEKRNGVWMPRPTDQRYNVSLFFTDYFPGPTRWTMTLKAALADGLPFGAPRTQGGLLAHRAPAYKRVDVGMSYRIISSDAVRIGKRERRAVKNMWLGLDAFNLLGISNVNSYYWVTDISNTQYAVPNYLTGRLINLRLSIEF